MYYILANSLQIETLKPWQGKLFTNTVHEFMFLADAENYISIKQMAVTGNPRDNIGNLLKSHIQLARKYVWDTF